MAESNIHILAKEILHTDKKLNITTPDGRSFILDFDNVQVEVKKGRYIVDVVATLNQFNAEELVIEICYKNSCDFRKANYFKEQNLLAIEIQLPKKFDMEIDDPDFLEDVIWSYLNDPQNQTWIVYE